MQLRLLCFLGRLPLPLLNSIAFSIALTGSARRYPTPGDALPSRLQGDDAGVVISKIANRW
jgi:hypothetical protein